MVEVVLVRWPEEGKDGARLAREGVAVLYLVNEVDEPPRPTTCLEDWVRLPGDDRDVHARVEVLELRATTHHALPRIDDGNSMHFRGRVMMLTSTEARLARMLVEHFGDVVDDPHLAAALAVDAAASPPPPLQLQIAHLRLRLRDAGLTVRRIRRRGYQLESR